MSLTTDEDAEALVEASGCGDCGHTVGSHDNVYVVCWGGDECECQNTRVAAALASDWLAAHVAARVAEALAPVRALHVMAHEQGSGRPICRTCLREYPCITIRALPAPEATS